MDERTNKISFAAAGLTILVFSALAAYLIIRLDTQPHIVMLLGCLIVGTVGLISGCKWDDIEAGMVEGMTQALGACIILLLIGILIGIWIIGGVVPTLIYYGLRLLSPGTFLVGGMLFCALVSMLLGSWGAAGTVGIALISIAQFLNIPAPLAAGAIISGCYIGDRISPITDMSNLIAGVSEADVIEYVKSVIPLNLICMGIIGIIYGLIGMRYASGSDLTAQVGQISGLLAKEFSVSIWNFLPLLLLIGGMLLKLPAIPSIVIGILAGGVMAVFVQGYSVAEVLDSCFYGYVSESGAEMIDNLLTAGGIDSMQYSLTLALCALMFGGVMDKTGLMNAFMDPIIQKLRRRGDISAAVVVSTLAVNVIIPDNYVAIALPGSMFKKVYKKTGMPLKELARALGGGACSTSVLVPWNTCGIYMSTVLGVKTVQYMPFVFLNMLVLAVTILLGYFSRESAAKQEVPHTKEP